MISLQVIRLFILYIIIFVIVLMRWIIIKLKDNRRH